MVYGSSDLVQEKGADFFLVCFFFFTPIWPQYAICSFFVMKTTSECYCEQQRNPKREETGSGADGYLCNACRRIQC